MLEVDWDDTWVIGSATAFSHAQADITNDIRSLHARRGMGIGAALLSQLQSGQLAVELTNDTGKYSPNNTGSVLTGLIQPGHWVRLRTTQVEGGAYARTLWGGRLVDIRAYGKATTLTSYAILTAIGDLGWHAKRIIQEMATSTGNGNTMFTTAMTAITGRSSFPDHTLDAGLSTFTRYSAEGKTGYDALIEICMVEAGRLFEDTQGKMGFKNRHSRSIDAGSLTSQATLSDAAGAAFSYNSIKQMDSLETGMIYNEVAMEYKKLTVGGLATLWTLSETGASSPSILAGESKAFWARYPNPGSATNAVRVDAWTTPVVTTDFTANAAADGSGADHSADIGIAVVKSASFMKITLTNNAAVTVYITALKARGTPITSEDPVLILEEDAASQTSFGERRFPYQPSVSPWVASSEEAREWARFHLAMYKDKFQMFDCEVLGNRSVATLQTVLSLDLNNRVTVVANGGSQLGISSMDCFIEAIEHKIDRAKMHKVRYIVAEAAPKGDLWVWGYALWGTTTKWVY